EHLKLRLNNKIPSKRDIYFPISKLIQIIQYSIRKFPSFYRWQFIIFALIANIGYMSNRSIYFVGKRLRYTTFAKTINQFLYRDFPLFRFVSPFLCEFHNRATGNAV